MDEDMLLYETPEDSENDVIETFSGILKNSPPYEYSKLQLRRLMMAIKTVASRCVEARKTATKDHEILGIDDDGISELESVFSFNIDEDVDQICDLVQDADIQDTTSVRSLDSVIVASSGSSSSSHSTECIVDVKTENCSRLNLTKFTTDDKKFLRVKKVKRFCDVKLYGKEIKYSLGVTYDEVKKFWLICDTTHQIFKIYSRSENNSSEAVNHRLIKYPSALTIYEEGVSAAVLCSKTRTDDYYIAIYHYDVNHVEKYNSSRQDRMRLSYPCRGLARSFGGNLITLDLPPAPRLPRIRILNERRSDSTSFEIRGSKRPSFIASNEKKVAITDLGTQKVFLYKVDDSSWSSVIKRDSDAIVLLKVVDSGSFTMLKTPENVSNVAFFNFVAGVQFDITGMLIIGDAGGHSLKVFDQNLQFAHRISSDFPIPYMSSFHVNKKGEMILIDLRGEEKIVCAQLTAGKEILPWIETDHRRKPAERSRFSSRRFSPIGRTSRHRRV